MKAISIGTYADIPVKVHWTFGLLILFVLGMGYYNGMRGVEILYYLVFVLSMFVCVILHEYGHALTARGYGVKTMDIIISPIGGLARLERLPDRPWQEFVVAIAGPLVNVVIATILALGLYWVYQDINALIPSEDVRALATMKGFFSFLMMTNIVLFVFNLIPAFPMDGGRILRALLSMRLGKVKATQIASVVGRVIAVFLVGLAVYIQNYVMIFIGIFIFRMAQQENSQVRLEHILSFKTARDIMNREFTKLHLADDLEDVVNKYVSGKEKNFLVFDSLGYLTGSLPEIFLKDAYKNKDYNKTVGQQMSRTILEVNEGMSLRDLFDKMNAMGVSIVAIRNEAEIVGVIDRHLFTHFININA